MNNREYKIIKCPPSKHSGFLLKWGGARDVKRTYDYFVNPALFKKRDTLVIQHDVQNNAMLIINKMSNPKGVVTLVSMTKYNSLMIKFMPLQKFQTNRALIWAFKIGTKYTINLEDGRFKPVRVNYNARTAIKLKAKIIKPIKKVPVQPPKRVVKAYWQKHSDSSRNQFVRLMRYNELSSNSDGRVKRDSSYRYTAMKYLAWKLNTTPNKLPKLFNQSVMSSELSNSLVNWLTLMGFYLTYTAATKAIQSGHILVNNQVISTINYQVQVGDFICIVPTVWNAIKLQPNLYMENYAQVNLNSFSFIVLNQLNSTTLTYDLINNNLNRKRMSGMVRNPIMNLLTRGSNLINRSGR